MMDSRPDTGYRHLIALLVLAAAIRLPLAFWPNIIHPDEIFQYLEPAWRMLGHDSIISWEWRYGMRGWLVPSLLAGPVALGDALAPGGSGAFILPRLVAALASLTLIVSAWHLGARLSRTHAFVAAFVAAIWFEFVLFAPHTLSEPLASALILPAIVLVTHAPLSWKRCFAGGALLALAIMFRFQYAPAVAVIAFGSCLSDWRRLAPLVGGGVVALGLSGIADVANGAIPFAWVAANIQQNWLNDRAATFGVMPVMIYIHSFGAMWSAGVIVLLAAIVSGWRQAPLLLAAAVANIAFHALIGHKEYRFIYLSVVLFVIVAALGSANLIGWMRTTRLAPKFALPVVCGGWALLSGLLAFSGQMPAYWNNGISAARLAETVRHDPALCGLALYETPVPTLPGQQRLAGSAPIYGFDPADPAIIGNAASALARAAPAFNRILGPKDKARDMPAGYAPDQCADVGDVPSCIFSRAGGCERGSATPFVLNEVLARIDR